MKGFIVEGCMLNKCMMLDYSEGFFLRSDALSFLNDRLKGDGEGVFSSNRAILVSFFGSVGVFDDFRFRRGKVPVCESK